MPLQKPSRTSLASRLDGLGLPLGLAVALALATAILAWFGYDASQQSRANQRLLLERRAAEHLALLWAAIAQDMRGAHTTILAPITQAQLVLEPPYDLADTFARGFARFPYPESFFAWTGRAADSGVVYAFNRADRPPTWLDRPRLPGPYPVAVVRNPAVFGGIVAQARALAQRQARAVAVFTSPIGGRDYQVVVRFLYSDSSELSGMIGFTVDLGWVHKEYFSELVRQISRIGGEPDEVSLAVLDNTGRTITATQPHLPDIPPRERPFPLVFADRTILSMQPAEKADFGLFVASAGTAQGSTLAAAAASTNLGFVVIAIASAAVIAGLVMTLRAARSAADLAAMKSEFVSSVTHELKTPLSTIVLVAETFINGRYDSPETLREYAGLLSKETRSLRRIIENLLAYAGLRDAHRAYAFESVDLSDMLDDVLQHFDLPLRDQHFEVSIDMPPELPPIRADRGTLMLALENLIDNAIKYAGTRRVLTVSASLRTQFVALRITDAGIGIPDDEIDRVCDSFFRGRGAGVRGSGIGLAITSRIVEAHGGRLRITSPHTQGTTVELLLPLAALA